MSEKSEGQPELSRKEESKLFRFKDKYNEFQIPKGLQLLVDQKSDLGTIGSYLYIIVHVASSQQANYRHTEDPQHFTLSEREKDPVSADDALKELSKTYEGEGGMGKFIEARKELLELCGSEFVLELEQYLGVDSRGLEAGDKRPLLGVDRKTGVALAHYIQKEKGYQELG